MAQTQTNGRTAKPARSTSRRRTTSSTATSATQQPDALVSRVGPLEVDWPRSLGFFGGIALAVGIGMIDPPVGLFIAAVPFLKMLNISRAPTPSKFVGQVVEGMAKPVGGDSQGTVRIASSTAGANSGPVSQNS